MTGDRRSTPRSRAALSRPLAEAWTALGATGAVLGVLVLACVFVAVAGPRESLALRTRALQQTFAAEPVAEHTVQVSAGGSVASGPSAANIATLTDRFARIMRRHSLPLTPGAADWGGLSTPYGLVAGAGPRAINVTTRPRMNLIYRQGLSHFARLTTGRMAARSSLVHAGQRVTSGTFEVTVTRRVAARFGLHPGSRLVLTGPAQQITLTVTGIIQPLMPRSAFWTLDPSVAAPFFIALGRALPYWTGSVFVGPAEAADVEQVFSGAGVNLAWVFPLDLGGINADQVQPIYNGLTAALDGSIAGPGTGGLSASSGLFTVLPAFLATQSALSTVLFLLTISLVVIGAVAVLLGARIVAEHRDAEFALMRARGASLGQIAGHALRGAALVSVPAAVLATAAAVTLIPAGSEPLPWWLAAVTLVTALAGPPLIALHRQLTGLAAERAPGRQPGRQRTVRRRRARRLVADCAVVAACAGGLVVLHQQGLPPAGRINLYASAAPVLVAAPAALIVLRLYPFIAGLLLRLAARRPGATAFIGLARAARGPAAAALPAFALVLALAVVAFGAMMRVAITRGQDAASWQVTGADAAIGAGTSPTPLSPALERGVGAVPGVARTATVLLTSGSATGGTTVQIAGVSPAAYAALTAGTPYPRFPAARLAEPAGRTRPGHRPVPVLASPAAAAVLGRGTTTLTTDGGTITLRVAGTLASTPALPGADTFVVVPAWAEASLANPEPPNLILVTGPRLDTSRLAAVVRRLRPGASITFRSAALAAITATPLPGSAYAAFALGTVAAAVFSAAILLLALAAGAGSRQLTQARLSTMGLGRRPGSRLAMLETGPAVLAAVAGGAACAWALVPLIGPDISLAPFTGSVSAVSFQADPAVLGICAAGLVVLALLTLIVQTAVVSRHGPARALRAGG